VSRQASPTAQLTWETHYAQENAWRLQGSLTFSEDGLGSGNDTCLGFGSKLPVRVTSWARPYQGTKKITDFPGYFLLTSFGLGYLIRMGTEIKFYQLVALSDK